MNYSNGKLKTKQKKQKLVRLTSYFLYFCDVGFNTVAHFLKLGVGVDDSGRTDWSTKYIHKYYLATKLNIGSILSDFLFGILATVVYNLPYVNTK